MCNEPQEIKPDSWQSEHAARQLHLIVAVTLGYMIESDAEILDELDNRERWDWLRGRHIIRISTN